MLNKERRAEIETLLNGFADCVDLVIDTALLRDLLAAEKETQ